MDVTLSSEQLASFLVTPVYTRLGKNRTNMDYSGLKGSPSAKGQVKISGKLQIMHKLEKG